MHLWLLYILFISGVQNQVMILLYEQHCLHVEELSQEPMMPFSFDHVIVYAGHYPEKVVSVPPAFSISCSLLTNASGQELVHGLKKSEFWTMENKGLIREEEAGKTPIPDHQWQRQWVGLPLHLSSQTPQSIYCVPVPHMSVPRNTFPSWPQTILPAALPVPGSFREAAVPWPPCSLFASVANCAEWQVDFFCHRPQECSQNMCSSSVVV